MYLETLLPDKARSEDKTLGRGRRLAHSREKSREELGPGGLTVCGGLNTDPAAGWDSRQKFWGSQPRALFH